MNIWRLCRLAVLLLLVLGMVYIIPALAAANNVPVSGKLDTTVVLTVQRLQRNLGRFFNLQEYSISGLCGQLSREAVADENVSILWARSLTAVETPKAVINSVDFYSRANSFAWFVGNCTFE